MTWLLMTCLNCYVYLHLLHYLSSFTQLCCDWSAGYNVVIVKNGRRICGSGAALANAPIAQNKAYFETKLQSSG